MALNVGINFLKATTSGDRLIAEAEEQTATGSIALYDITIRDDRTGELRFDIEFLGERLIFLGYKPDFAEDGVKACEKYQSSMAKKIKFNAVIMDLTIPGGMGGKETIKKILKIDPEAKVIVSSGYSNDPVMSDYKSYGFSGVVSKPFKMQELSAALHKIL